MSEIAQYYEIRNLDEAKEYLANDILRNHLFEISQALLNLSTNDPLEVLGYLDNLKLKSCMTLIILSLIVFFKKYWINIIMVN